MKTVYVVMGHLKCPLDADFQCSYTGTDWWVVPVPFGSLETKP